MIERTGFDPKKQGHKKSAEENSESGNDSAQAEASYTPVDPNAVLNYMNQTTIVNPAEIQKQAKIMSSLTSFQKLMAQVDEVIETEFGGRHLSKHEKEALRFGTLNRLMDKMNV